MARGVCCAVSRLSCLFSGCTLWELSYDTGEKTFVSGIDLFCLHRCIRRTLCGGGEQTRDKYVLIIKEGRLIRNQIHSNEKKIRRITRDIRRDKNEAIYNLQKYDDEIAKIEQMMSETADKKKDALNTFETVTKNIIADEIAANSKEKLDLLGETCEFQEKELKALREELKAKSLFITDNYGSYLEKEFLQPERLDALLEMIDSKTAANLTEAMDEYKKRHA